MWFNRKREKDLLALVDALQARCDRLENDNLMNFSVVKAPGAGMMPEYHRYVAELTRNEFYLFHWSQERRKIIDEFEMQGTAKAEFYRGKLAAIGDIFRSARNSGIEYDKYRAQKSAEEERQ
jgi:hypothetical protein